MEIVRYSKESHRFLPDFTQNMEAYLLKKSLEGASLVSYQFNPDGSIELLFEESASVNIEGVDAQNIAWEDVSKFIKVAPVTLYDFADPGVAPIVHKAQHFAVVKLGDSFFDYIHPGDPIVLNAFTDHSVTYGSGIVIGLYKVRICDIEKELLRLVRPVYHTRAELLAALSDTYSQTAIKPDTVVTLINIKADRENSLRDSARSLFVKLKKGFRSKCGLQN